MIVFIIYIQKKEMLEDRLPEIVRSCYNIKVLTIGSDKAKESLAAKGITPAIFFERFFKEKGKESLQIAIGSGKEKIMKPMPEIVPIDYYDYFLIRRDEKDQTDDIDEKNLQKRIFQELQNHPIKFQKHVNKDITFSRVQVERFLNNQSFHWFDRCNKLYFHALSLTQSNYRLSTIDQPQGIAYLIEVEKDKSGIEVFESVKKNGDNLMKKLYQLNPVQLKSLKIMVVIMIDISQRIPLQNALAYTTEIKNHFGIQDSFVQRLSINGDEADEVIDWSQYGRPLLHYNYRLKTSDKIKITTREEIKKAQQTFENFRNEIQKVIKQRMDILYRKYQQLNATKNKFLNFFKGSVPNDKTYTRQEAQMRELGDKLFLVEDYKKAYDVYRYVASKLENRNPMIEYNLAEMIHLCLAMSKFHHGMKLRSDPFREIEKYASKILEFYNRKSNLRHKKYLIFLMYVFHTFRSFEKSYIRGEYYSHIKQAFTPQLSIINLLVYEQYANMCLLFKNIDHRRYCYDLTRVASRFTESKLYGYALRCLLIVESLYDDTFPNIEKYHCVQLAHLYLELKNIRQAIKFLKKGWEISLTKIQNQDSQKDQAQLQKFMDNFHKLIRQIQKIAPFELQEFVQPNISIPAVQSLNMRTFDQMLENDEKTGCKWSQIGDYFVQNKDLLSQGLTQALFRNIFKSYDTGVSEEKSLMFRFKSDVINQLILKKNSRHAYVGQPVRISFYFKNPIRFEIQVENIAIHIKQTYEKYKIVSENEKCKIKPYQSTKIVFNLIPEEEGYLQLERITWSFKKMAIYHKIKDPLEIASEYKSCYFKLNIFEKIGMLEAHALFDQNYYEGQRGKMQLILKNSGLEKINKIYIGVGDPEIFDFKIKELQVSLEPDSSSEEIFPIKIPEISERIKSGEEKKIIKIVIMYETKGRFRSSRILNKFNILRVSKLENFICERLSTHLHLLSYTKKIETIKHEPVELQWLLIPSGFEILKMQATQLTKQIKYFFFLRKGNYKMQKYYFYRPADFIVYPENIWNSNLENDLDEKIEFLFLWRNSRRMGMIKPQPIPIIINPHTCISNIFPIDVKVHFKNTIEHNFEVESFLKVPVQIRIKNIFQKEPLKVTTYFIDSRNTDACWEGIVEKKVNLDNNEEVRINATYVVIRSGIYEMSNQLKYTIQNIRGNQANITHSQYEQIYLTITNKKNRNQENFEFEDAFKQFVVEKPKEKKSELNLLQNQSESLI